jgi:hypothetical protein
MLPAGGALACSCSPAGSTQTLPPPCPPPPPLSLLLRQLLDRLHRLHRVLLSVHLAVEGEHAGALPVEHKGLPAGNQAQQVRLDAKRLQQGRAGWGEPGGWLGGACSAARRRRGLQGRGPRAPGRPALAGQAGEPRRGGRLRLVRARARRPGRAGRRASRPPGAARRRRLSAEGMAACGWWQSCCWPLGCLRAAGGGCRGQQVQRVQRREQGATGAGERGCLGH